MIKANRSKQAYFLFWEIIRESMKLHPFLKHSVKSLRPVAETKQKTCEFPRQKNDLVSLLLKKEHLFFSIYIKKMSLSLLSMNLISYLSVIPYSIQISFWNCFIFCQLFDISKDGTSPYILFWVCQQTYILLVCTLESMLSWFCFAKKMWYALILLSYHCKYQYKRSNDKILQLSFWVQIHE